MIKDGPKFMKKFNAYDPNSQLATVTGLKPGYLQSFPQWMSR